ncbi:hypothetical protein NX722_19535 [Endozoicomonas gorgoniicola]|uniref:Uncharacterized protein n=1 Tax=Endozoicomonas gorgoniicola TaxID=1234144 RepID=A0ABT3MZG4_9GAMM|nr:hypothetical protein [Endozoicomonas gorgoniicola]MCW7554770.1 hypothetical protein [Endozoicomonas gorgoniicola]
MQEMINSKHLLIYSRNFFKESLKAGNKTFSDSYGNASQERKDKRGRNAAQARARILSFRTQATNQKILEILHSFAPSDRAGNCNEYALVAIDYGVKISIPDIWLVNHSEHVFVLLANTTFFHLRSIPLSNFSRHKNNSYWICDPWFNIHCKMCEYEAMAHFKAGKWEQEGKRIGMPGHNNTDAKDWLLKLYSGEMKFYKMTSHDGTRTTAGKIIYSS